MLSINTSRRLASVVITIISLGVFLSGCEAGDQEIGASGIDGDRPVERFKYDSPEQLEELAKSLNYTPDRCRHDPAVSSPEYYLKPAPNAEVIGKPQLDGRHLIILNKTSHWSNPIAYSSSRPLSGY